MLVLSNFHLPSFIIHIGREKSLSLSLVFAKKGKKKMSFSASSLQFHIARKFIFPRPVGFQGCKEAVESPPQPHSICLYVTF